MAERPMKHTLVKVVAGIVILYAAYCVVSGGNASPVVSNQHAELTVKRLGDGGTSASGSHREAGVEKGVDSAHTAVAIAKELAEPIEGLSYVPIMSRTDPTWIHIVPIGPAVQGWWAIKCFTETRKSVYPVHYRALHEVTEPCARGDANDFVIDIGANLGTITGYASARGCRVIGVEPQRELFVSNTMTAQVNGWSKTKILRNVVSTAPRDSPFVMKLPGTTKNWGEGQAKSPDEGARQIDLVYPIRLDDLITRDVLLLKIDVEGFEEQVIVSGKASLEKYNVQEVWLEWNPASYSDPAGMLKYMHRIGYTCYVLNHGDMCVDHINYSELNKYGIITPDMFEGMKNVREDLLFRKVPFPPDRIHEHDHNKIFG